MCPLSLFTPFFFSSLLPFSFSFSFSFSLSLSLSLLFITLLLNDHDNDHLLCRLSPNAQLTYPGRSSCSLHAERFCVGVVCCVLCVVVLCGTLKTSVCRFKTCVAAKRPCHKDTGVFASTHAHTNQTHTNTHTTDTHKATTHRTATHTQRHNITHTETHTAHTTHTDWTTRDNSDCRHIDHLTPHKEQAMQLTKNMKTHYLQFWLRDEQHWLQSIHDCRLPTRV